jgi:uncharacterized protein YdeI (YjbR/CyaY-like superfamily)
MAKPNRRNVRQIGRERIDIFAHLKFNPNTMASKDPRVDSYIAKSADFAKPILTHIRELVHQGCPEVEETLKWSMPFFMYKGMFCHMAAFNSHCSLGFWKSKLIMGKDGASNDEERDGMGQFGKISSLKDLPGDKKMLAYIKEAKRLNDEGIQKPSKPKPKGPRELAIPTELAAALKKNKKASATFEGFSYSHKKEYVEWISEAKREETKSQRLATTIAWLTEGKSRHWKYANC